MTDEQVMTELRSNSRWNLARQQFSYARVRLERIGRQRIPVAPIDTKRMEFEAVLKIVAAFTNKETAPHDERP